MCLTPRQECALVGCRSKICKSDGRGNLQIRHTNANWLYIYIYIYFCQGTNVFFNCWTKNGHINEAHKACLSPQPSCLQCASIPERSGMWIACFNVRMKVVLNVKVSCTVGVGADQNPVEKKRQCQTQSMVHCCCNTQWQRSQNHGS